MRFNLFASALAALLLLVGCAKYPPDYRGERGADSYLNEDEAQPSDKPLLGGQDKPEPPKNNASTAYRADVPVATAEPMSKSSRSLLKTAQAHIANGQLDLASDSLERAIRIDAEQAILWSQLSEVRLRQGRAAQAEYMAQKSNALLHEGVVNQASIRQRNWMLIQKARVDQGNFDGANAAQRSLEQL